MDKPDEDGIVKLVLDVPSLNAVSIGAHRVLAEVWPEFDAAPEVRAVLVRAEAKAFSAGGSSELTEKLTADFAVRGDLLGADAAWPRPSIT